MIINYSGKVPSSKNLRIGVQENNLVDSLVFIIDRRQGAIDLFGFTPKIKIVSEEKTLAEDTDKGFTVEKTGYNESNDDGGGQYKITYPLPDYVTREGNVDLQLYFTKTESKDNAPVFQTQIINITFDDAINVDESIRTAYPNIVRELTDKTNAAVDTANKAEESASAAVATADEADKKASHAESLAESVVSNETARQAAERERQSAEIVREENETSRKNNETVRKENEMLRVKSEDTRHVNETTRQSNETARKSAEDKRVVSENSRVGAEDVRSKNETSRQTAENARAAAETNRADAEKNRVSNETTRQSNETTRKTSETERQSNETTRQNNESTRKTNETARGAAEDTRKTNETARISAENTRKANEDQRIKNENQRIANENARQEELEKKVDKSQLSVEPSANKVSQFDEYGNQKTGAPREDNDCVRQVDLKNALQSADNFYAALLNDTNTTSIFKAWYNAVSKDEGDRFTLLERFFKMCALNNNQIHTVRFVSPSVSSESRGTPLDWLADKKAQNLSTDAGVVANANKWIDAEGTGRTDGEDWATENRLTWYIRANALSLENGKMNVTAIEGIDSAFDITGETAPVYTFQLSPYFKETDDGTYLTKSWRATPAEGYAPFNDNVDFDGNPRPLTWHASFGGSLATGGKLTSGANKHPANFNSASAGQTAAQKWNANEGCGADANAKWILYEWQHRHFNLENSGICEGCLSYSPSYVVAVAESDVKRVVVTTAQGANFVVGSNVYVGDNADATKAPDRGAANARNISNGFAKILSIESVTIDGAAYTALNLELSATITTTATTWVQSAPWDTGTTEKVSEHNDGSIVSLTNGKYPLRCAGMEVLIGAYFIGLDILYNVTANATSGFDYAIKECKNATKYASSITADYNDTGLSYEGLAAGWNWVKKFKITDKPVLFVDTVGGSSSGWLKSAVYGSYSSGVRCPWRFGPLYDGTFGGLAYEILNDSPFSSDWSGVPWLAGAEKKRGEYAGQPA